MSEPTPYAPPAQPLRPEPNGRGTSRLPDLLGLACGVVALGCAVACAALHSCMCGHLAHDGWSAGAYALDGACWLTACAGAGVLLLAGTCLRVAAAFGLLALLPRGPGSELGLAVALVALILLTVSAIRGRGPALVRA